MHHKEEVIKSIVPENLKLSITTNRESYVRSESIDLKVTLLNNSSRGIQIEDLTINNNPLHIYAVNNAGKEFLGSLQSPRNRDGVPFPPLWQESLILLDPKTRIAVDVDLLNILGELAEGNYEVKARYISQGILYVESNKLSLKILKSTPSYSKTFQDYLRVNNCLIRTAWINSEEDGLYVLIMENSQHNPSNIRSNRRIIKIDEVQKVCPSILASPEQYNEHLMWIQDETLKVATIEQRVLKDVKGIKLPIQGFQILEPMFTSENGKLYFIATLKKKAMTIFQLITYSDGDTVEIEEICKFEDNLTKYSITYDEKPRLHMAWASEVGNIFYTWIDIEQAIMAKGVPKIKATGTPPILDLQLSKACENEEGNFQLRLNFVNYASSTKLQSQLINPETGREVFHSFHELPELEDLMLLQTVLDLECKPHFLFQDRKRQLWFKSFRSVKPIRVTEEGEAYPGNIDYPVMLVSSNQSRHYGIYLRYIKDQERFIYKKLTLLT